MYSIARHVHHLNKILNNLLGLNYSIQKAVGEFRKVLYYVNESAAISEKEEDEIS